MFDKNEQEHIKAFQNGNRFETNMDHDDCLRCDVVNGKYGANVQHEFLEFDHESGKNIPRDLGHKNCPHCMAGADRMDVHLLNNPDANIFVGEDGSIITHENYKRKQ